MQTAIIGKNDAGQRLDKYLTKRFPNMPLTIIYKGIRKKRIKLNGGKCDIAYKLVEGDMLELYINDEFLAVPEAAVDIKKLQPELTIIYEDDNILLLDKRPGVSVHPDETDKTNTLISNIQAYLYITEQYNPDDESSFSPALCNRIDKNTGGIVIAAKNAMALRTINYKIKNKEIEKYYLCLVHGYLKRRKDVLTAYHIKDTKLNRAFIYDEPVEGSKVIKTAYRVLKEKNKKSLLEVALLTGKTHQIRAHFAHIGHPLVGDTKYGTAEMNKNTDFKYQALYSYKIKFEFTTQSPLEYLNHQEFKVSEVDFSKRM